MRNIRTASLFIMASAAIIATVAAPAHATPYEGIHIPKGYVNAYLPAVGGATATTWPVDEGRTNAWHYDAKQGVWLEYSWRLYRDRGNKVPADIARRLRAGENI